MKPVPRHPGIDCEHIGRSCARCLAAWEATEWLIEQARAAVELRGGIEIVEHLTTLGERP